MWHGIEYKLSALQVRISEENKLNSTTQQIITEETSGCALKQGSKTHPSLPQSNLPLQNEAARMSRRITALEHRKCAAGLSDAHPDLQDRILLNYTRIENAHKVNLRQYYYKKTCDFCNVYKSSKLLVVLFPCWDIIKCLNASVNNSCFWAPATVLSCYRNW